MHPRPVLSIFVAVALSFAAASCDFSPTSPFSGFSGEEGATLHGQFRPSDVAAIAQQTAGSTYHAQTALTTASEAEPVRVIVLASAGSESAGSEIGSVDIVDGSFTLRGLPETFYLRFVDANGKRVGKDMRFEGVKPNQEIDIVVAVVDGKVVLLQEKRTGIDHEGARGIELEGTAQNIVIFSSDDPMTGSLNVTGYGYDILTRAAETSIRKGNRSLTLEDLDEGDKVHVRGVFEGDDVFAYEIKLQEEIEDEDATSPKACNVRDPEKPNHILVCHGGRTLSIAPSAWADHHGHGDGCGPCR
jgi:hypothetical protein